MIGSKSPDGSSRARNSGEINVRGRYVADAAIASPMFRPEARRKDCIKRGTPNPHVRSSSLGCLCFGVLTLGCPNFTERTSYGPGTQGFSTGMGRHHAAAVLSLHVRLGEVGGRAVACPRGGHGSPLRAGRGFLPRAD